MEERERIDLSTPEVVAKIRERHPDFAPSAYLGGTHQPDSFKWLLTVRLGTKKKIYGYLGAGTLYATSRRAEPLL